MFSQKKTANSPEAIQALFATLPNGRIGAMETGTNAVAMLSAQNCVKGKKDTPFTRRYYR